VHLIDDLAGQAGIRLDVRGGGLCLVSAADAPRLLDVCLERRVRVFDVEAFIAEPGNFQSTGEILDLSSIRSVPDSVAESRRFVSTVGAEAVSFDFTLLDPPLDEEDRAKWRAEGIAQLAQILYWRWDPLGMSQLFPDTAGEYDQYAEKLVDLLGLGVVDGDVGGQLGSWERIAIGAPRTSSQEKLTGLEEQILDWYDRSTAAYQRRER
jgi:hypothetical protein